MIRPLPETSVPPTIAHSDAVPARTSLWRDLYLQAIFEFERTKVAARIQDAQRALILREHQLSMEPGGSAEREAIINALHCLEALQHCSNPPKRQRAA